MTRNGVVLVLCAGLVAFGAWRSWSQRPVVTGPGVLVGSEPRQTPPTGASPIAHGAYSLERLADFEIEARVLSREDYRLDAGADLAPTDFALGWQRMSDTAVIDRLDIRQSARFFTYHWRESPPIPPSEIVRSATNVHLIPADDAVERGIARVRVGDVVTLRGALVDAHGPGGWRWTSSLSREDSGAGACELLLVESLDVH